MAQQKVREDMPAGGWRRRVVCVDFDGTIAGPAARIEECGAILPGAREALASLRSAGCKLVVHTARPSDPGHMQRLGEYLQTQRVPYDEINVNSDGPWESTKPLADLYIDNLALRFNGDWPGTLREAMERLGLRAQDVKRQQICPPHLIAEWEAGSTVVLPWPHSRRRKRARTVIERLVTALRRKVEVRIVSDCSPRDSDPAWAFDLHHSGHWLVLRSMRDLWIRDWAPLLIESEDRSITAVKPIYRPSYSARSAARDDRAGVELASGLKLTLKPLGLVWDMGNMTHNGRGTAIATEQLRIDNPAYPDPELRGILLSELGIEKLVLVPWEPGDVVRHVDGTVRFVAENKLVVGAYPPGCALAPFMDNLADRLRRELGPELEIHRIRNTAPAPSRPEGIPSAIGNYVNFLRCGNVICLPQYDLREDDLASSDMATALPECEIVRINATELAELGGVLNCVSWILVSPRQGDRYPVNASTGR